MEFIIGFLISIAILIAVIAIPVILSRISKQLKLISSAMGVLNKLVKCPECNAVLELNNAERIARRFECPYCKKVTEVKKREE